MNAVARFVSVLTVLAAGWSQASAQDGCGCAAAGGCNAGACEGGCEAECCDVCACECCNGPTWHAWGELLYWRAERESLDFAVSGQPVGVDALRGQVENLRLDPTVGFRVGGSYGSDEACQLGATYTHFRSDDERTVTGAAGTIVPILVPARAGFDRGDLARASAEIRLDIVDIEASRWFHPYCNLALRGFAGVRYAQLEQDFDIFYRATSPVAGATAALNLPNSFHGLGLRTGLDGAWKLTSGLSVFGRAAISILEGELRSDYVFTSSNEGLFSNLHDESWRTVPVLETAVGVTWRGCGWGVSVGYEFSHWFNVVNEYSQQGDSGLTATLERTSSDLGFHGLFGRVQLDF